MRTNYTTFKRTTRDDSARHDSSRYNSSHSLTSWFTAARHFTTGVRRALRLLVAAFVPLIISITGCGLSAPHDTFKLSPVHTAHDTQPVNRDDILLYPKPGTDDAWTSQIIGSTLAIEELILSWNADVPTGAMVTFEVRARNLPESLWTPWLALGSVTPPPPDPTAAAPQTEHNVSTQPTPAKVTAPGGYEVDVDILRCKTWFREAQIRCVASTSQTLAEPVRITRLDLTRSLAFSKAAVEFRKNASRTTMPWDNWNLPPSHQQSVTFKSQKTPRPELSGRLCSPTCVAMAIGWGVPDDPASVADIAQAAYDQKYDIYGNWPRNVQAAWEHGLPGYIRRFGSLKDVYASLAAGNIIVASIKVSKGQLADAPYDSTDGHLILLRGYTERGDFLVSDPAAGDAQSGERTYKYEDMTQVWLVNGKGTAYVFWKPTVKP